MTSKTILITGASRGIGLLTAKTLAAQGHTVYASMRNPDGSNALVRDELVAWAKDTGAKLIPLELDVTSAKSVDAAAARILADGPLDVLINNAGIMPTGTTEAFTPEQTQACFDVNMFGLARVTQAFLPAMRDKKDGLIISLSSAAGRLSIPFFGLYCASKWAMEAYCESLHFELEPFGVQSVLVEPSGHGTDLVATAPAPARTDVLDAYGDLSKGRDRMLGMFESAFATGADIHNAQNVADAIAGLVNMTGPRPVRTQVGDDMGVNAINTATQPVQDQLVSMLRPVYTGAAA